MLLRVGWGFDLSRWQMLTKIYLPAVTNPLLTGLRLGVAMAIIGVLSAEISYANAGLGYRLIRNADQFKISSVYAIIILIFAVSATINFAIIRLQQRLNRHERSRLRRRPEIPDVSVRLSKHLERSMVRSKLRPPPT